MGYPYVGWSRQEPCITIIPLGGQIPLERTDIDIQASNLTITGTKQTLHPYLKTESMHYSITDNPVETTVKLSTQPAQQSAAFQRTHHASSA